MRVLHYMFGIPPVRTGGLVRYAADLMRQEMKMGIDVHLLIPGTIPIDGRKRTKVKKRRKDYLQIPTYEIYHPLPVPMCNGISDIKAYTEKCHGRAYQNFLKELQPDLVHIHTFMGLHREFLAQPRRMGIPVLFTTHDYFGICPTAVMLYRGSVCRDYMWKNCGECCNSAFSKSRLYLEQSGCYRMLRRHGHLTAAVKKAAQLSGILPSRTKRNPSTAAVQQADYAALRNYYRSMFDMVSYFHFNSWTAEKIYKERIGECIGKVVNISHAGILDHRRKHRYGKTLRIGYFGSWAVHKGFFALLAACGSLHEEGCTQLELHLYSSTETRNEKFVKNHPSFRPDQLERVFRGIDLLAVPSLWPETFGLTALEALSYGVPVVISKQAGVNDMLQWQNDSECKAAYDSVQQGIKSERGEKLESGAAYGGMQHGIKSERREKSECGAAYGGMRHGIKSERKEHSESGAAYGGMQQELKSVQRDHSGCRAAYGGTQQEIKSERRENAGCGFLYDGTQQDLERVLREVYDDREMLVRANEYIVNMDFDFSYKAHVEEIVGIYRQLVKSQDVR